MAYFLRPPRQPIDRRLRTDAHQTMSWRTVLADGTKVPHHRGVGIHPAPLVAHDRCVPEGFENPISTDAGPGWDWCWDFLYSDKPDAPDCYFCGVPVVGRG